MPIFATCCSVFRNSIGHLGSGSSDQPILFLHAQENLYDLYGTSVMWLKTNGTANSRNLRFARDMAVNSIFYS